MEPVLEAGVVDEANSAWAVARNYARVLERALCTPTESALALCLFFTRRVALAQLFSLFVDIWLHESHLVGFFEVLLHDFIAVMFLLCADEFFDSELHTTKFDHIKFVDFYALISFPTEKPLNFNQSTETRFKLTRYWSSKWVCC